jgi:23S rRNA (uracil1939-C5)-methyltransferase
MGYYRERSRHVVGIEYCQVSHALINQIIIFLRGEFPFLARMKEIEINVSPEEGKGILIFHPGSLPEGWENFSEDFFQACSILKGYAIDRKNGLTLVGDPYLNFTVPIKRYREKGRLRLRTSPQSFFQVNPRQNEKLIQTVLEFSDVKGGERVLDLYAGIGNLTLPLATKAKEVIGIEENRSAFEDARFNLLENGIRNCDFRRGRVEDLLKDEGIPQPNLIVLDPPRMGCKKITGQILGLKPKRIVYVSCEPTTLSRDLCLFSERGYRLQKLALIDMFPQTYHMEVVALLKPN